MRATWHLIIAAILASAGTAGCRKSSSEKQAQRSEPVAEAARRAPTPNPPADSGAETGPAAPGEFRPEGCVTAETWTAVARADMDGDELPYSISLVPRQATKECPSRWRVHHADPDDPKDSTDDGHICVRSVKTTALRPDRVACLAVVEYEPEEADADDAASDDGDDDDGGDGETRGGSFVVAVFTRENKGWQPGGVRAVGFEDSDGMRGTVSSTAEIAAVAISPGEKALLLKVKVDRFIGGDTTISTREELLRVHADRLEKLLDAESEEYSPADTPDPPPHEGYSLFITKDLTAGYFDVLQSGIDTGSDEHEPAGDIRYRWNGRAYVKAKASGK